MTDLQARPTIYKGIQMRSRLEAGYAAWLDSQEIVWDYEPHCFASEKGQYLPDFRLHGVSFGMREWQIYVETKPAASFITDQRTRMRAIPGAVGIDADHEGREYLLLIQTPERSCLQHPQWDTMWFRSQWSKPFRHEPPVLTLTDSDQPWHGEWWKGPSETPVKTLAPPVPDLLMDRIEQFLKYNGAHSLTGIQTHVAGSAEAIRQAILELRDQGRIEQRPSHRRGGGVVYGFPELF